MAVRTNRRSGDAASAAPTARPGRRPASARQRPLARTTLAAGLGLVALALASCTVTTGGHGTFAGPGDDDTTGPPDDPIAFGETVTTIESRRLAYAVPRPDVEDESFTESCIPTLPLKGIDALSVLFVEETVDVFGQDGFVAGYSQCRHTADNARAVVAAAFEMRDEQSATTVIEDAAPTLAFEDSDVVTLPGVQNATALTGTDSQGKHVLQTLVPLGRLVLYQYSDDTDPDRLIQTAAATITSALRRAQNFHPTPLDQMNDLRDDPRGLGPMLPDAPGDPLVDSGGYTLDAYYGIAEDPDTETELLGDNGFQEFYLKSGSDGTFGVYELADEDAANAVLDGFVDVSEAAHPELTALTVPAAEDFENYCYGAPIHEFVVQRCFFVSDQYLFQTDLFGDDLELADPAALSDAVATQVARIPG